MMTEEEILQRAQELARSTNMSYSEAMDVVVQAVEATALINRKGPDPAVWGRRVGWWVTILVLVVITGLVVKFIDWIGVAH
jgi:hypothetical protein